jgi:TonB-linked SusC/RagA family outer membrane protein
MILCQSTPACHPERKRRTKEVKQLLRIMKLLSIILLSACLTASAKGFTQTITLSEKNAPLEKVFKEIKKQTGYNFLYTLEQLDQAGKVDVELHNATLEEALGTCLKEKQLTYTIVEKTVIIKRKELPSVNVNPAQSNELISPPPVDITGRITNNAGEPLAGASVIIKRTGKGDIADANGQFKLKEVLPEDIIVISFVGYKQLNIKVGDRTNFTLLMDVATGQLDAAVVQAYGKTTDRLRTGNIGRITAEDIAKQPVMNVLQALQGQVTGVLVTQTNGFASAPFKVEIRGRNTISPLFTSEPLYVIDGVPLTVLDIGGNSGYDAGSTGFLQNGFRGPAGGQSPLFSLNPADIESIEILKDADATAIYGSRAGDGVILITTKKAKAAKTQINISAYQGISEVAQYYKMLNTQQYLQMRREAFQNDGLVPNTTSAPDLLVWDTTRYTNWQKYIWGRTGKVTDAQAALSGGDSRTTFRIGTGFRSESDVLATSGKNQRASLSFNFTNKTSNQKFSVGLNGLYTYSLVNQIYMPAQVTLPPNAPAIWDNNGNLNYAGWAPRTNDFTFGSLLNPYNAKTNFYNLGLSLQYQIFKGLNIKTDFGYNQIQTDQITSTTISSQNPANNPTGSSSFGFNKIRNLIIEPQITYENYVNKGLLSVLVGVSKQNHTTDAWNINGSGYTNDALLKSIIYAPIQFSSNYYGEYKYAAIFGRVNYNWKNKYILNLNARRDGSSKFGPGRQFGNFGSIGTAWIISEENWIKNRIQFLSFAKLRGSYGAVGNDKIGDYSYLPLWNTQGTGYSYNGLTPLSPLGHSDSLLQWEVNRKLELAVNLGFFKDRITLEVSWYRNRCNNQLVQFPTPSFTGFNAVTSNSPANVQNSGLEFLLNSKIFDFKNFSWSINFNVSINRNKLLAYPNLSQSPYASAFVVGKPLNIKYLFHYTGVDPQTGLYTFEDKNKDGRISLDFSRPGISDDRSIYDLSPKFLGGIANSFKYKSWDLSFFVYFKKQIGRNAYNSMPFPGTIMYNQPIEALERWQKTGDNAPFARFTNRANSVASYSFFRDYSDGSYTDASFIRFQNISLGCTIPQKVSTKIGISNCRLFFQGQNLFTITDYKGIDPEIQYFGAMPSLRVLTAGVSCNF